MTVDGEQVVRVRGDAEHPVSRGYTCSKGRGLAGVAPPGRPARPAAGRRPRRAVGRGARRPRRRGCATVVDDDGADAVALYLATGLAYDARGQVAAGGLDAGPSAAARSTPPRPSTTRRCSSRPSSSPGTRCSTRCGTRPRPGCCSSSAPTRSSPTATAPRCRTRSATCATTGRSAGEIWVVDPRRTETAALADEHLAVRPGSDVACSPRWRPRCSSDGADPRRAVPPRGPRRAPGRARAVHGRRARRDRRRRRVEAVDRG